MTKGHALIHFHFFFFFLTSCTLVSKQKSEITSVNLNFEKEEISDRSRKKVDIEESGSVGPYGPGEHNLDAPNLNNDTKTIAVIITPGLYRTLLALDILKCFEMNERPINVISGVGFGAILAAMYAQGMTSEEIRWKLFNHIRSDDKDAFSRAWVKSWDEFVGDTINHQHIIESKTSLWLPKLDSKKVVYKTFKAINQDLAFNYNNEEKFVLDFDYYNFDEMAKIPVDNIVIINTMPKELNFKKFSDLKVGIYGKVFSYQNREKQVDKKIKIIEIEHKSFLDDETNKLSINQIKHYCSQVVDSLN